MICYARDHGLLAVALDEMSCRLGDLLTEVSRVEYDMIQEEMKHAGHGR